MKRDPLNAAAYSTAAEAWFNMSGGYLHPSQAIPNARTAARRAIELDPRSDAARAVLGRIHWDWPAAEEQLQRAIDLNPNSAKAYRVLACLRMTKGRQAGALESVKSADQLEPRFLWGSFHSVSMYSYAGRYDEAIAQAKRTLEWEPDFGFMRSGLGMAYLEKGRVAEGIRELEAAVKSTRVPTTLGLLAVGYARGGRTADAERIVDELVARSKKQYVCPFEVGAAFAALG